MESALYGIYPLVVFVSEILLVRCAHSFDFWYVNNSCVNTVRQHFPWSILYISYIWSILRDTAASSELWSAESSSICIIPHNIRSQEPIMMGCWRSLIQ